MKSLLNIEEHPLEPFLPVNAKLLMLGSFPPQKKRWSMEFFYPNLQYACGGWCAAPSHWHGFCLTLMSMWKYLVFKYISFACKRHCRQKIGQAFCCLP
jgi:hypothetical protein